MDVTVQRTNTGRCWGGSTDTSLSRDYSCWLRDKINKQQNGARTGSCWHHFRTKLLSAYILLYLGSYVLYVLDFPMIPS